MSVLSFTASQSAAVFSVLWGATTNQTHNALQTSVADGQIDGRFTGTQVEIQMMAFFAVAAIRSVLIDGAAVGTPANMGGAQAWQWETLASGLADGPHTFSVKFQNNAANGIFVDTDAAFRVTGAAPAMSAPDNFGAQLFPTTAAVASHVRADVGAFAVRGTTPGSADWFSTSADAALTFRATCAAIQVWAFQDGCAFRVRIDPDTPNATETALVATGTGAYVAWTPLATGLDGTAEHVYQIVSVAPPGSGASIRGLTLAGGSGLNTSSAAPAYTAVLVGYGDSITVGTQGTSDSSLSWLHRLARAKGWAIANEGVGSTTTLKFATGASTFTTQAGEAATRTVSVTGLSPAPAYCVVLYGANDAWQQGGAETAAQYQGAYYRMMSALTAALPATVFLCVSVLPSTNATLAANRVAFNAGAKAAVGAGGDGAGGVLTAAQQAQIRWVDSDTFGLSFATDYFDAVHPNSVGCAKIAAGLLALLSASAANTPNAFLPAHLRTPHGRTRVGPGVKTH